MITKKIKNNKEKGFVLLFAVMLSSIILAIALGISNIALKEVNFSTSVKDANDAFFAADAGAECVLYNDFKIVPFYNNTSSDGTISCEGRTIPFINTGDWYMGPWNFILSGLGSTGKACAMVHLESVDSGGGLIVNTVISKGYSNGGGVLDACTPNSKSADRELQVTF